MPRKSKPVEYLEEPLPSREEMDIEDFLEEWGPQTSVVEIYQRKTDGSMPHQQRVGMEILRADLYGYLREKFGAGKFVLHFKDGNRRIVKNLTVDVGPGEKLNGVPSIVAAPIADDFNKQLMLALIASIRPPDIGAMMTGLGTVMAALKPANASDPAAMLAAMAATFQQLKPAEDNVEKALKVISLAKDIGGSGEPKEENFYSLIKDVGKVVVEKLNPGNGARPAIPAGAMPVVPALTVTAANSTPVPVVVPESPDMLLEKWLRAQLQFLKQKARAGKDVEFWTDYIFDNEEEPGCHAILEAIERGATFDHLLQFDPEIGENPILKPWFEKLYAALHTELHAPVDTSGTGGDTANLGSDADPSAPGRGKS